MKQLSSLDAQFLAIEDGRRTGHVAALAIHDPSTAPNGTLTCATMMDLLNERMHLLPPLRWRLAEVPFGLDYPYWVDDDDFDMTYHVRESALPSPGSDHQLAELVSRLHARQLDRARPLWEMYVISGLRNGYVAVYTKIHHALIDGVSGAEITGLLLDVSPRGRPIPPAEPTTPERQPGSLQMWGRALFGVQRYPIRVLRSLPHALPNLEETTLSAVPGVSQAGRLLGRLQRAARPDSHPVIRSPLPAPKTSFNRRVSPNRRFAFGRLELQRVKDVKNAFGVTVNDVVVTICAGAVRRWLLDHKELPEQPLVAQIPVSVRTEEQAGTYGNHVLMMSAPLHTDIADPAARLKATAAGLGEMKERHRALPADLLCDINHFIPPALFNRAARATFALATSSVGRPTWNVVVSNIPGPQFPLYCGGAQLVANYPVSAIADGLGLNITVMSYDGQVDIGIVADREQVPDVWTLLDGLDLSLTELEDAGR
ncbi:WS/DGAT/MGAT family O-acyltransferase [Mycobacterium sp.]|uniref:WS/DGAT/MGAT family O-acyltransferase n=1 Tax=Mycobacterium sp. TaxID=1785 RepID=UPI003C75519D